METTFKEDYYSNGQLWYKHQFLKHNGKQHGEQFGYNYSGTLRYIEQFINGKEVTGNEWIEYQSKHKTQSLTDMYV